MTTVGQQQKLATPSHGPGEAVPTRLRVRNTSLIVPSILLITTLSGAHAAVEAIRSMREGPVEVRSLQELYRDGASVDRLSRTPESGG